MDEKEIIPQTIVRRSEWGALPARKVDPHMTMPVKRVLFSLENEWDPCTTQEDCSRVVRCIQQKYQDQGLDDIPYNFIVGNDGNVYEGRGWAHNTGTPHILRNEDLRDQTIDICVTCGQRGINYDTCDQVRDAFRAVRRFMDWAVSQGELAKDYVWEGWADEVETLEQLQQPPPPLPDWQESLRDSLEYIKNKQANMDVDV